MPITGLEACLIHEDTALSIRSLHRPGFSLDDIAVSYERRPHLFGRVLVFLGALLARLIAAGRAAVGAAALAVRGRRLDLLRLLRLGRRALLRM